MTLKSCYKLHMYQQVYHRGTRQPIHFASTDGRGPTCLEEKLKWVRYWQTPHKVIHYQVEGCIACNIRFRCDSMLTVVKRSDCTNTFIKITVVSTTAYQVTVQKSIDTVSCKMKNFRDLSQIHAQCWSASKMAFRWFWKVLLMKTIGVMFKACRKHCVLSLLRHLKFSLVLVQPGKTTIHDWKFVGLDV